MKENESMSHSTIIEAVLKKSGDQDLLIFNLEREHKIQLNSSDGQQIIKELFSDILSFMLKKPITINLRIEESYGNSLMIDVCKAYIKDLNKEISQISKTLPEELKIVT
jgi:hypothetical protein